MSSDIKSEVMDGAMEVLEGDGNQAQLAQLADSVAMLEGKLADEIRLRRYTEQVLDSRQLELESQQSEKRQMASEIEGLKRELAALQTQVHEARGQTKARDKQLADAKDQIFKLQPTRKDITEADAVEGYRLLCGNVQRWVDNRTRVILEDLDQGRLKGRPAPPQSARFVSFMKEAAKRGVDLDQSDGYHVIAIIMNYLCLVFFTKSFYSPLDDYEGDATLAFINDLESSMSKLPRDAAHCRHWRTETLIALTSQQGFKTRRARYINLVSEDLASLLSVVAPKATASDLQGSLRRSVVEPAADLAHQLHLASNVFSLKWPARGAWSRLELYECLNLATGGAVVDLSGTGPDSPARRKVSYMFDVAPGLFVERIDGGKKMTLKAICRPAVLVYGGQTDPPQPPQKATVMRWLWDSSGGPPARDASTKTANPRSEHYIHRQHRA
ncbi:uncharacterized protein F5Z01DRAFT_632673 [Emericellopsis atlantica]|uniref:Uncharacterized protein n=1 Tax=Emericellopsis atlantica TaxID=2614577 RepID=A0A9P8CTW1_9HYPO|nr:uncharacterized protein F5Z01DRAFT_632673 [Emericellopsis atlantica]KAG9258600.1 hypothetical protein F5Z01DRAFT_632673 [Emericellopsis atlantica]